MTTQRVGWLLATAAIACAAPRVRVSAGSSAPEVARVSFQIEGMRYAGGAL